ncbi:MAG TPA: tyrosine-type recombinase/integrase [Acidimicrobiales bacterium]|nr:tyrosine-type recombinase/integrase [Acidimicrobiales bacterium]
MSGLAAMCEYGNLDPVASQWAEIAMERPQLAETARRYLGQIALSLRPGSVTSASIALRQFCWHLIECHPEVESFAQVTREHVESFKMSLHRRRTWTSRPLKPNTLRQRLLFLRSFFDRIIEWGWADAPSRPPVFLSDVPPQDLPLPKALDDAAAARFLQAAESEEDQRRRLVVQLLARTGMRVGELYELRANAMECRGGFWWLRVPLGKLHNDRVVPLHPRLVELIEAWKGHPDYGVGGRLVSNCGRPLNRHAVTRMVRRVAKAAGIGHVHPHQLRHTLATQALNRGMSLEAVAQLLGHQSLKWTVFYARLTDRTLAEQFRSVADHVDSLYMPEQDGESEQMRKLRLEHSRLLANGWCTRPKEMDCQFDSICEGCGFFATTVEFKPTLERQRDHAAENGQPERAAIFEQLLQSLEEEAS